MIKNVYFIGVGGIGMSAIARYYKFRGLNVSGYDRTPSDLTRQLEAEGIAVHYEDNPDYVPRDRERTLVVWTPAIPREMRELVYVREHGYPLLKRSRTLGEIARGQRCLAVAGTHGKTTTSTLLAHILTSCGEGCTAFLGGISKNYGTNFLYSDNPVLVAEADEFDRSFLQLFPEIAVITAMDADHLDIYNDLDHVREAFREFASQVGGTVIAKYGLPLTPENIGAAWRENGPAGGKRGGRLLSYAFDDPRADFYAANIVCDSCGYFTFDLHYPTDLLRGDGVSGCDGVFGVSGVSGDGVSASSGADGCVDPVFGDCVARGFRCGVPGRVNVENSVAAAAIALTYGLSPERIRPAVASFSGVKRRFDIHFNVPGHAYVDDYAHHPKEIAAALRSIRDIFPGRHVTAVFQPHLYTRTRDFAPEFAEALSAADRVVLLDIYPARELPIPGVDSDLIFKDISVSDKVRVRKEELVDFLSREPLDVLVTFGAGDIDRLVEPLTEMLARRFGDGCGDGSDIC